jgi:hypothetical protein
VTMTTLFDLWDDELEALRRGFVAAGLEPRLHRCWAGQTTAALRRSLDEYRAAPDELGLADCVRDLEAEIAYRTGGPRT